MLAAAVQLLALHSSNRWQIIQVEHNGVINPISKKGGNMINWCFSIFVLNTEMETRAQTKSLFRMEMAN